MLRFWQNHTNKISKLIYNEQLLIAWKYYQCLWFCKGLCNFFKEMEVAHINSEPCLMHYNIKLDKFYFMLIWRYYINCRSMRFSWMRKDTSQNFFMFLLCVFYTRLLFILEVTSFLFEVMPGLSVRFWRTGNFFQASANPKSFLLTSGESRG